MAKIFDVMEVIKELNEINNRVETLLKQLPTDDYHKISELYQLITRQSELMWVQTTRESGTMLLDKAKRVAQFLKREYLNARYDGKLRKEREST